MPPAAQPRAPLSHHPKAPDREETTISERRVVIGSRRSALAMTQTHLVRDMLLAVDPELDVQVTEIVTSGDKILDSPLSLIGDRGLFVKEIEEALLGGDIDLAVHSAKDVPTELPGGLALLAFPEREDPADAFVGRVASVDGLASARVVGTSSLRRRSQLLARFPNLEIVDIRGNVETRIRKITEEGLDGTILAVAGLHRLGRLAEAAFIFPPDVMVSAVGQGSLAIEAREDDARISALLARLDHPPTRTAVLAERALMRLLEGGCQVPIGARAWLQDGAAVPAGSDGAATSGGEGAVAAGPDGATVAVGLEMVAYVGGLDGAHSVTMARTGSAADPEGLGRALAEDMLAAGAAEIMAEVRRDAGGPT